MKFKFINVALMGLFLSATCLINVANANLITIDFDVDVVYTNNVLASWQNRDDLFLSIVIDTETPPSSQDPVSGTTWTNNSNNSSSIDGVSYSNYYSVISLSSNMLDSFSDPDCLVDWGNCISMVSERYNARYEYDTVTGAYTDNIQNVDSNNLGFNFNGWGQYYIEQYMDEYSVTPWTWETLNIGQRMNAFYKDYTGGTYTYNGRLRANYNEFETLLTVAAISVDTNEVPEPSTLAIFALGMIGLASRRFKKKS